MSTNNKYIEMKYTLSHKKNDVKLCVMSVFLVQYHLSDIILYLEAAKSLKHVLEI